MRLLGLLLLAIACMGADSRRSGFDTMSPALQAMQRDDAGNPAMLWVEGGRELWGQRCSACHGDAARSMTGVAARYPAFDAKLMKPVTLMQRIQAHNPQLKTESDELLSVAAFLALQSRGMPIAPPDDARLRPFEAKGKTLFERRMGQLNLSCAQCHDQQAGKLLGGSLIPQAHPTGYPLYRLEWQALGSLPRRLRNCAAGVRAQAWDWDAEELVDLELYLMRRAQGMNLDAPAVRP